MHRRRYILGWLAVATVATAIALATVVLVRGAVGGESVVGALSPADVSARLSAAAAGAAGSQPATAARSSASSSRPGTGPSTQPGGGNATATATPHPSSPGATPSHRPTPTQAAGGSGPPMPTPTQSSITRLLTSGGGSVVARCTGSHSASVYLVSWSPAQGFTAHPPFDRGPAAEVEIEFESDSLSVTVHVHCSSSGPVQTVETDGGRVGGDD